MLSSGTCIVSNAAAHLQAGQHDSSSQHAAGICIVVAAAVIFQFVHAQETWVALSRYSEAAPVPIRHQGGTLTRAAVAEALVCEASIKWTADDGIPVDSFAGPTDRFDLAVLREHSMRQVQLPGSN